MSSAEVLSDAVDLRFTVQFQSKEEREHVSDTLLRANYRPKVLRKHSLDPLF